MPDPQSLRDVRRAEIVRVARRIVAEEGLDALTFVALERHLDFTRGVVTYHFRNKDEIVRAVFEGAIADIERDALTAVKGAQSPVDGMHAVIGAMVGGFLGHTDAPQVLVSYWGRLRSDPALAEVNAGLYRRWRGFCAELVARGIASGHFRADADADTTGALIVGQVIGIATQAIFEPGAVDVGRAVSQAADALVRSLE